MVKTKKIQIKDLTVGMKIKTKDEKLGIVFKTVTDKWDTVVNHEDQVRLEFENGVVLNCSINHPIMIWSEFGEFIQKKSRELTTSDRVLTESGFTRLLVADFEQHNDKNYIDITVEDTHTFFASDSKDSPMILTHNSQGGIRNASCTVYFPIWHYQFDDLIVLKNNQGTEETRVRHLDYAVVLNAFFWRRFKNKENITFFDPNEVPDMYEAFYSDTPLFEKLYMANEQRTDLRKKVISAEEVFKGGILKERTDTGRIYLMYTDNVQNQGPFDPATHTIYQSNLCLTGDTRIKIKTPTTGDQDISLESFVEQFELGRFANAQVKTYNILTNETTWGTVTNAAKTARVTELIKIEDESGNIIRCTPDHQIYTKNRGYVRAGELIETDVLCAES
jgi:hypothetical protein